MSTFYYGSDIYIVVEYLKYFYPQVLNKVFEIQMGFNVWYVFFRFCNSLNQYIYMYKTDFIAGFERCINGNIYLILYVYVYNCVRYRMYIS